MDRFFRILGILTLLFLSVALPVSRANAAVPWVYDSMPDCMDSVEGGKTAFCGSVGEHNAAWAMYMLRDMVGAVKGKTTNSDNAAYIQELNRNSALGGMVNIGLAMYSNPPANLALWVDDTAQSLGFKPKSVYAQGIGFSGLSGLLPLWKAFRNIAYLLLAIALIVIGFMVMLRKKIDPKTVVTVQNALPKIVMTLILITFSYAIVGLMIDLMYLIILIVATVLVSASGGILPPDTAKIIIANGGQQLWRWVFGNGFRALDDVLTFLNPQSAWAQGFGENWLQGIPIVTTFVQTLLGFVEGILLTVVFAVLFIIAFFRILAMLVAAYIQIILHVIFAPLFILLDVFPGSEGFSNWLRNVAANILVFPVTAALFMIIMILNAATVATAGGQNIRINLEAFLPGGEANIRTPLWSPPILFPGGLYGATGVIGLGMLLAIPKIVGSLKEALKAKPVMQAFGGGVGESLGTVSQLLSIAFYVRQLLGKKVAEQLVPKQSGGGSGHAPGSA